jgi:predicted nucleotidyltransferase
MKELPVTTAHATDLARQVLSELGEHEHGLVLYGSRARGTSRSDSDIDVLQLVEKNPRSYTIESMNVTTYTATHLMTMAARGSLFVRHLIDEGIVLSDPCGLVTAALGAYREPPTYLPLKIELRVLLEAISKADAAQYRPLLDNLTRFTVRSALYVRTAELGEPIFDVEAAASAVSLQQVGDLLRSRTLHDVRELITHGMRLLDVPLPAGLPGTLRAITVWSIGRYPLVSSQLEHAIAGNAQIDYSLLSLPPS